MAERRMFAKTVVNSARFLRLPPSARLLYYDLGMAADDDGIVEAFVVCRTTGAAQKDLDALVRRGLVATLDEDDQIVLIVDWKKNNLVPKDRYRRSIYLDLLDKWQTQQEQRDGEPCPERSQSGNGMLTQDRSGKDRIDQDRTDQDRIDQDYTQRVAEAPDAGRTKRFQAPSLEEVAAYCAERGGMVDPVVWYDFYLSKGWKVGRSAMKDWRASVRTWERNGSEYGSIRAAPVMERSHDLDDVL